MTVQVSEDLNGPSVAQRPRTTVKNGTVADPKLPHGSNYCLCVGCGEYFNSDAAFMKHRREGRCLSVAEMQSRGMAISGRGYWLTMPNTYKG